jgi:hypothetical protein
MELFLFFIVEEKSKGGFDGNGNSDKRFDFHRAKRARLQRKRVRVRRGRGKSQAEHEWRGGRGIRRFYTVSRRCCPD